MSKLSLTLLASLTSALLLAGCGQVAPTIARPVATQAATVATVSLKPGDTPAAVEAMTGGKVLLWNAEGCDDHCTAVVSLTQSKLMAQGLNVGRHISVEANHNRVKNLGARPIWIWSVGMQSAEPMRGLGARPIWIWGGNLWQDGQYQPLPENTAAWQQIGLPAAQASAPNAGKSQVIAVIDTGVDLEHPALKGALTPASTWLDLVDGDTLPQDDGELGTGGVGHGTAVAGIATQVAPMVQIMPVRALGTDGSGDISAVVQAIVWAVDHGANIINLSLGSTEASEALQSAVRYADEKGVAVVAAAGNAGNNELTYPAAYARTSAGLLSVGSVSDSDVKSGFSNYAASLEVLAPGERIATYAPNNKLALWTGTSMSAPVVAGLLALMQGERQAAGGENAVTAHAHDISGIALNQPFTGGLGYGRIDAAATVLGWKQQ